MRKFLLCLLVLSLIIPIVASCATQPVVEVDEPQFSQDEVIAIVKRDLLEQGWRSLKITGIYTHSVKYAGQGKWQGKCEIELEYSRLTDQQIKWNFYEKSQIVEIIP